MRCFPDSKTPLFTTLGASWAQKHRFGRARCPLVCSKSLLWGLLGAACRIEIAAPDLVGTGSLLEIPACVDECTSLPHFAAFLFAPVGSKSLPLACWALPERSNLMLQICSTPPFLLKNPQCLNERRSPLHFAAFRFTPMRSKSLLRVLPARSKSLPLIC